MKKTIFKYLYLIAGLILISISFTLLYQPYNIVFGDILGLAIIVNDLFSFDNFMFLFAFNIILIVVSYIFLGEQKTLSAAAYTILLPFFILLLTPITNIISLNGLDKIIIAIIAGLTLGFGSSLIYSQGFLTGGTDIIGDLIKKAFKIRTSCMNVAINSIIVLISGFAFGIENAVYGGISLFFVYTTIRKYRFGINANKTFYILSDNIKEIEKYFKEEENQKVTIFDVTTGLKKEKKKMIMCVLKTKDYYKIRTAIEIIDPDVFITISDSYEAFSRKI